MGPDSQSSFYTRSDGTTGEILEAGLTEEKDGAAHVNDLCVPLSQVPTGSFIPTEGATAEVTAQDLYDKWLSGEYDEGEAVILASGFNTENPETSDAFLSLLDGSNDNRAIGLAQRIRTDMATQRVLRPPVPSYHPEATVENTIAYEIAHDGDDDEDLSDDPLGSGSAQW